MRCEKYAIERIFHTDLVPEQLAAKGRREFQILVCHKGNVFQKETYCGAKNTLSSVFFTLTSYLSSLLRRGDENFRFSSAIKAICFSSRYK